MTIAELEKLIDRANCALADVRADTRSDLEEVLLALAKGLEQLLDANQRLFALLNSSATRERRLLCCCNRLQARQRRLAELMRQEQRRRREADTALHRDEIPLVWRHVLPEGGVL